MSRLPTTAAGKIEYIASLIKSDLLSSEEVIALLDGKSLAEYRASKTKLGKLLAGKDE